MIRGAAAAAVTGPVSGRSVARGATHSPLILCSSSIRQRQPSSVTPDCQCTHDRCRGRTPRAALATLREVRPAARRSAPAPLGLQLLCTSSSKERLSKPPVSIRTMPFAWRLGVGPRDRRPRVVGRHPVADNRRPPSTHAGKQVRPDRRRGHAEEVVLIAVSGSSRRRAASTQGLGDPVAARRGRRAESLANSGAVQNAAAEVAHRRFWTAAPPPARPIRSR